MSLHFRKYKNRNEPKYWFGILLYDKRQPTLDIIIGNHVFVVFWRRREL